jgi:hypothetical protein
VLARAIGHDVKGNLSLASYVLGIVVAALGYRWLAFADLLRRGARLVHPRPAHRARARGAKGAVSRPRFTNTRPEVHAHEARTLPARYYNDASLFEDELRLIHQDGCGCTPAAARRSTRRAATSWCASRA